MKTLYPCRECSKRFLDNGWTQNNNAGIKSEEGKLSDVQAMHRV